MWLLDKRTPPSCTIVLHRCAEYSTRRAVGLRTMQIDRLPARVSRGLRPPAPGVDRSPPAAIEVPDVLYAQVGRLHGGEVAAAIELGPVDGVVPLRSARLRWGYE